MEQGGALFGNHSPHIEHVPEIGRQFDLQIDYACPAAERLDVDGDIQRRPDLDPLVNGQAGLALSGVRTGVEVIADSVAERVWTESSLSATPDSHTENALWIAR